jgi:signal peptidase
MTALSESLAGAAVSLAAEALDSSGQLRLRATGTSMLPALRPGDMLQFHSYRIESAAVGDIVLFRRADSLVIHRVIARSDTGLVTQGDALAAPDPPVSNADVLGTLVSVTRRGRRMSWNPSTHASLGVTRWLFRRFDLATRLFLRWHRLPTRASG